MQRQFIKWLTKKSNNPLDRSYLFMRKGIGVIGVALPIVLIIGMIILERRLGISDSISAYYYSVMGNVFVGSLCATGIFLICYRYDRLDDVISTVAGACAIGVAFFPTAPDAGATEQQTMIGHLHTLFAAVFFVTLAIFSLWIFRKKDPKNLTPEKLLRNKVYKICGITILICIALMVLFVLNLPGKSWLQPYHPVLYLEFLAIEAFGIAWFVKGETLLKDKRVESKRAINREAIPA